MVSNWRSPLLRILPILFALSSFACQTPSVDDETPVQILLLPDMVSGGEVPEDGGISREEDRLNSIRPPTISTDGDTRLTLIGVQFDEALIIRIGNRLCDSLEVLTATRAVCTAPPSTDAGPTRLEITWSDGHTESYDDWLVYYIPLTIRSVEPQRLSASTGGDVVLTGTGFVEDMYATVAGLRLPTRLISSTEARITMPRTRPGVYDLQLSSPNQSTVLENGLTLFAPIEIASVAPAVGPQVGGELVRISGIGFLDDSTVTFGAENAVVQERRQDGTSLVVSLPSAFESGVVDVSVNNTNGTAVLDDGFLYTRSDSSFFSVLGVQPNRIPSSGGMGFWIGGQGFNEVTRVRLNGQELVECVVESSSRIYCDVGVRQPNTYDLTVSDGLGNEFGPFALEIYSEPFFFSIEPSRGSVAGGTLVTIYGEGFLADIQCRFFDQSLDILSVEPSRILALTPSSAIGLVDLQLNQNGASVYSPDAFEYLDLGSSFGGVYGPSIDKNLNVAVYDGRTNQPIDNAQVRVTSVLTTDVWVSTTNVDGQVVLADPELSLPVVVTAGHPDYTSSSVDRVVSENVSLLLAPKIPPEGRQSPEAEPLVTVRGTVLGINALEKPEEGGRILMAVVETTHPYPNGMFSMPTPIESSILFEDGRFEMITLPGQFGVVVTVGLISAEALMAFQARELNYWSLRRELEPRAMGYLPFLTGHPNDTISDVEVTVDRLRRTVSLVSLDNPPGGVPNSPNKFLVRAILDMGADGYFDLGVEQRSDEPELNITGLPQIAEWPENHVRMRWEGEAYVEPDQTPSVSRYSWSSVTFDEVGATTSIGPFLPTTEVIQPSFEAVVDSPSSVQWLSHAGLDPNSVQEVPDMHYVSLSNQDGSLWTGWLPGAVEGTQLPLEDAPLRDQLAPVNLYYLSIFSGLADPQFNFDDFGFGALGRLRAYSWSYTRFADGEISSESDEPL